jgi:hypothetical protein
VLGPCAPLQNVHAGGAIGAKEIDRVIQKLQIDKEILADLDEGPDDDDIADASQTDREGNVK